MTPEFSRRFMLDTIGTAPRNVSIEATEAERAALARRFGLVDIRSLTAAASIVARAAGVDVTGRLSADLAQPCVVTGDPVDASIEEPFALRFVDDAAPQAASADEEVELSDGDLDTLGFDGGAVDLGEAVAQTLSLALDPFPRSSAAAVPGDGVWRSGADASPFASLKGLTGSGGKSGS